MKLSRALIGSGLALVIAACKSSDSGETTASTSDVVTIGSLLSLTGDLAGQGRDFADTVTLAIEEINAAGGVLGKPVRVALEDDGTTVDGAKTGFSKLLAKPVSVILGPSASPQVTALAEEIKSSGVLTIGATTTSADLTTLDDGDFFFRVAPSDSYQATEIAEQLIAKVDPPALKKLCIVYRQDSYGTSLANALKDRVAAQGLVPVLAGYPPESSDLSNVVPVCDKALRCGGPTSSDAGAPDGGSPCTVGDEHEIGIAFLTFVADGAAIFDSAAKLGWSAQNERFFFSDGLRDLGIFSLLADPAVIEGGIGTAPSGPDPATPAGDTLRQLTNKFRTRFGRSPNQFIENIYDAAYLSAAAIELAGTDKSGAAARDAIRKLQDPSGTKITVGDWKSIKDAIAAKQAINLDGASGSLDFDASGDILGPYYYSIWAVKNGAITNVRVDTVTP